MYAAEVVVEKEQSEHRLVVLNLLGKRVGETGETTIAHA